jgi:DNA-binding transcriptional ArsR family regulator
MANAPELLSALSHPTRQAIVDLLRQQPLTVGELAAQLPVTRPAVSQHLQALKSIGMVEEDRRGTRHYFRLNPRSLAELRVYIESMWRDALAGFSEFAKKETDRNANSKPTRERNSTEHSGRLRN